MGHDTIAEMLARHGIEPAPERERKTTWKEFLTQHWDQIVAADFFTIEAWTRHGLHQFIVRFLMELSTRHQPRNPDSARAYRYGSSRGHKRSRCRDRGQPAATLSPRMLRVVE
jgi:hypothetical protein